MLNGVWAIAVAGDQNGTHGYRFGTAYAQDVAVRDRGGPACGSIKSGKAAMDHGSISTPGFIMPLGSSSRLAPRKARANSSGRCLS